MSTRRVNGAVRRLRASLPQLAEGCDVAVARDIAIVLDELEQRLTPAAVERLVKRARDDSFSGGVVSALCVLASHMEDGYYDEVVECCGADELLQFARREQDTQYENIRKSVARLKRRRAR